MSATDQPAKEGWMTKQGGFIKTWKRRWFVLRGTTLAYFVKPGGKLKGEIECAGATEVAAAPECKKQPAFKVVVPSARTYYIRTDSDQEVQNWVEAITRAIRPAEAPPKKISLDDFDILKQIGKGTYGTVQLVRSKSDRQLYALKTMSKARIQQFEQISQTITERNVLLRTVHPFLVGAHFAFQTETDIFLVLDYVPGGELFKRLQLEGRFSESRTQFYAAEILLGIGHLHKQGFIYRDLKPENILLDAQGHLKITDFGLVKTGMSKESTTATMCGTPEYVAPEMVQQKPYTMAVDWWSFGVLIFEMLTGLPPFFDENPGKMYRAILTGGINFPPYVSEAAKDLISGLLEKHPESRLGSGPGDYEDIQKHPFFNGVNWDALLKREVKPEFVPEIKNDVDTSNFDHDFQDEAGLSFRSKAVVSEATQSAFVGFTCTGEDGETPLDK